ncbi:hypothetical protein EDB19DRAFT_1913193 [Suillus lakei]|nr:hypothetical protein EDB19DRAFT_1913193 [Suillus lakei]
MELNAAQIRCYLDAYRSSSSGKELYAAWGDLSFAWDRINAMDGNDRLVALTNFTRLALSACRQVTPHLPHPPHPIFRVKLVHSVGRPHRALLPHLVHRSLRHHKLQPPGCATRGIYNAGEVAVLDFANTFGSPYLMFWLIFLSIVWLMTQLSGQIVLGLSSIALLSYLEIIDSVRDVHGLNAAFTSTSPTLDLANTNRDHDLLFSEIIPLALLATHTYYSTGHQSTFPSVQWKSVFVLGKTLSFPFSHLSVALFCFSRSRFRWSYSGISLPSPTPSKYRCKCTKSRIRDVLIFRGVEAASDDVENLCA